MEVLCRWQNKKIDLPSMPDNLYTLMEAKLMDEKVSDEEADKMSAIAYDMETEGGLMEIKREL